MAAYEILGVYRITPTAESILEAVRYHGANYLLDEKGLYKGEIYWENHENLCLVEMQARGEFSIKELHRLTQNDQAPYMEFYLEAAGNKLISEDTAIAATDRRICFFLHFVDISKPLVVDKIELRLLAFSTLPDRLKTYTHYLPVG